jgi:CRISPR-associated protein Csb2
MSFLPLPTINPKLARVEGIARVLVAAPAGYEPQIEWLSARLAGQDLVWKGEVVGFLDPLPSSDWVLRQYVEMSTRWSTVTPVVLPGHDDRSETKGDRLLRRAFLHAGVDPDVVASIQELEWRKVGFRPGTDLASRYLAPDKITGPMFHVRVRFAAPYAGPLSIGSGRFRGMGVFAKE